MNTAIVLTTEVRANESNMSSIRGAKDVLTIRKPVSYTWIVSSSLEPNLQVMFQVKDNDVGHTDGC